MAQRRPGNAAGIALAYEKMVAFEEIAGDPRYSTFTRRKAQIGAEMMRRLVEQVPDNG